MNNLCRICAAPKHRELKIVNYRTKIYNPYYNDKIPGILQFFLQTVKLITILCKCSISVPIQDFLFINGSAIIKLSIFYGRML